MHKLNTPVLTSSPIVKTPILDWGGRTISQGNKVRHFDEQGERTEALPVTATTREIGPHGRDKSLQKQPPITGKSVNSSQC
jgi:hypothetical protein